MFSRFNNLNNRIILSTSMVLIGLLLLLVININHAINSFAQNELEKSLKVLQDNINSSLATPLFSQDFATIQDHLSALKERQPNLIFMHVKDMFNHEAGSFGKNALKEYQTLNPESDHQVQMIDIFLEGEKVGSAQYFIQQEPYETLREKLDHNVLFLILLAITLSITLISLITNLLTKGLDRLSESSKRIASGDYHTPVKTSSSGDIGKLSETFEEMRSAVLQREQDLELEQNRLTSLLNTMTLGSCLKPQITKLNTTIMVF